MSLDHQPDLTQSQKLSRNPSKKFKNRSIIASVQSLVARDQSHRVSQREVVDPRSTAGSVAAHDVFRADRLCRTERPDGIEKVGKGDVDGDGEPRRGRAEDVGREPAEHGRDAGKGPRGGHDEAAVAGSVGGGREGRGHDEAGGADEGGDGCVDAAGVEVVGGPGEENLEGWTPKLAVLLRFAL